MRLFQLKHGQATAVIAASSIDGAKELANGSSSMCWGYATALPIGFCDLPGSRILCLDYPGPNRIFKFTSLCKKVAIVIAPNIAEAHCRLFDDRRDSYWSGSQVEELGHTKDGSRIVFTDREKPKPEPYCWEARLENRRAVVVAEDKDEVIDLLEANDAVNYWRDAEINMLCEAVGQESHVVAVS